MVDQTNKPVSPRRNWRGITDKRLRELALITPADVADAIKHLRQRMPDLAQKWGLNARRPAKNPRRTRR